MRFDNQHDRSTTNASMTVNDRAPDSPAAHGCGGGGVLSLALPRSVNVIKVYEVPTEVGSHKR